MEQMNVYVQQMLWSRNTPLNKKWVLQRTVITVIAYRIKYNNAKKLFLAKNYINT